MYRLTADQMKQLQAWAKVQVRSAYLSAEEIEDSLLIRAREFDTDVRLHDIRCEVRNAIIEAVEALTAEQADWPVLTDVDRLDLAFEQLDDAGIIARQHFGESSEEAGPEITTEVMYYIDFDDRDVRGFVYFHADRTETAIESGVLYLNFGSVDDTDFESDFEVLAIGREVTDRLQAVGLDARWNARLGSPIAVYLNWQKRWEGPVPAPLKPSPF